MLRKIIHIAFAFLLLLSTVGISVSRHLCMGNVYDVAILKAADTCSGDLEIPMDCCDDETEVFSVSQTFEYYALVLQLEAPSLNLYSLSDYFIPQVELQSAYSKLSVFHTPSPPLTGQDIYVSVQSFLL